MSYEARNGNRRLAMESPGTGPPQPMTVEEYARFEEPDDGYSSELFQGIVIREPLPGGSHGRSQSILARRLGNWMEAFGQGEVFAETGFIISDRPATVRGPDVAVLLDRRSWEGEPGNWIRGAPDVAVEVLSPSNRPGAMREKMRDYFDAGALRVWMVDPKTRTVTIHRADGSETIFRDGDRLEDPDVLPGFGLEVRELFER